MPIIIRVRSPSGTQRITLQDANLSYQQFVNLVATQIKAGAAFELFYDASFRNILPTTFDVKRDIPFTELNLKHGDMIFARVNQNEALKAQNLSQSSKNTEKDSIPRDKMETAKKSTKVCAKQSSLDFELEKEKGSITRERDPDFCKHNANAMCEYCMPMEPYDPKYLSENKIKHMSFHSYLRKSLSSEQREAGLASGPLPSCPLPLEELSFQAKKNCNGGHAPWPEGICTKCQPSAITLQQQEFRMTDHLEFAEASIIEKILSWWRETGTQRFGLMYGRYEKYTKVPLGIKAVVEAIYEPQQTNMVDGLVVDIESPEFTSEIVNVNAVAKACGLELVGIIFTDLTDDGSGLGKVEYKRHKDSYFLTGLETRLAAKLQNMYPNHSRWSQDGTFGSRIVTAVVSGNENSDVGISAWQISNTGAELERSQLIIASSDPSYMMVKNPESKFKSRSKPKLLNADKEAELPTRGSTNLALQYIPDILYKYTNEYNVSVTKSAKPHFPVEYLLVSLTHGFPQAPTPLFKTTEPYCIENRHSSQTTASLYRHMYNLGFYKQDSAVSGSMIQGLSDFHLLVYICSLGVLTMEPQQPQKHEQGQGLGSVIEPINTADMPDVRLLGLIATASGHDSGAEVESGLKELLTRPSWMSLITVLADSSDGTGQTMAGNSSHLTQSTQHTNTGVGDRAEASSGNGGNEMDVDGLDVWSCRHCTFDNDSNTEWCAICGLPRND